MSLQMPLHELAHAYEHREESARRWHSDGGQVVGVICDVVPAELIEAAGFMPYRLAGKAGTGLENVQRHITSRPGVFGLRPRLGSVTSMLEQLLDGSLDFIDHLVIPRTRTAVAVMHTQLELARREDPSIRLPNLFYLDKVYTQTPEALDYNASSIDGLWAALESWRGAPIAQHELDLAVEEAREGRALQRQIVDRRRAAPATISGTDALRAFSTAHTMARREHNALLRVILDAPETEQEGSRIMVSGSPLGDDRLYRMLESTGAVVVAEEHCWGERGAERALTGAHREAVAQRYHHHAACCVDMSLDAAVERCVERAHAAGADLVFFFTLEGDDFEEWQIPTKQAALERAGIMSVVVSRQAFDAPEAHWRDAVVAAMEGTKK